MRSQLHNLSSSPKWIQLLLFTGVFLLAAGLRLANIDTASLWIDEIYSLMVANVHVPPEVLDLKIHSAIAYYQHYLIWQPMQFPTLIKLLKVNVHLPQFYLLLNPWLELVGNTAFGLRSFAAFFSVLLLFPLYQLGKALGKDWKTGFFCMFVAAVVPFQLYFAQEGRMYTLSLFWAVMAGLSFWKTLYSERPFKWSLLYAISVVGGFFSHYIFAFYLMFHVVYAVLWLAITKNWKRFCYLGIAFAAFVLAAGTWFPIYKIQQQGVNDEYHFAKGLKNPMRYLTALVWQPLVTIAGDNRLERIFYLPFTVLLFLLNFMMPKQDISSKRFRLEVEGFLLSWVFVPLLVQIGYDFLKHTHTVVIDRYIMLIAPAMCIWLGLGLTRLWVFGKTKALAASLMLVMLVLGFANIWHDSPFRDEHNKKDTRGKILWMTQQAKPDDLVFVNGPWGAPNLAAWYLVQSRPEQPMLYWLSEYHGQTVPLPEKHLFKPYSRVWLFRDRANNERGLQKAKNYLQSMYPHLLSEKDWFIYSR